jgi:hypothetical protein
MIVASALLAFPSAWLFFNGYARAVGRAPAKPNYAPVKPDYEVQMSECADC